MSRLSGAGELPVLQAVGKHWIEAGDVDVVGVAAGKMVIAGSAKWSRAFVKPADLADLRRDVARIDPAASPILILFSRSGFDGALRSEPNVRLVGPPDLFRAHLDWEAASNRAARG